MKNPSASLAGTLYIVATPIGNLGDISLRALEVLKSVDCIATEDTRHSKTLLNLLGITKPLFSLHAHNEAYKSSFVIEQLLMGKNIALISDAGTPLISDPGFPLVVEARTQNIAVVPIPGACALITALSAAGVPCDHFTFVGFLPAKPTARRETLHTLLSIEHTLVFYESPHRIKEMIDDLGTVLGQNTAIVLAKELTKHFERFISGTSTEVKQWLDEDSTHCKGEFVVIVPTRNIEKNTETPDELLSILLEELPLKQAVKLAAKITQIHKNVLYQRALDLKNG